MRIKDHEHEMTCRGDIFIMKVKFILFICEDEDCDLELLKPAKDDED